MSLDKNQVKYVAELSRIELDDKALDDFTKQLDKILKYMEKLNQLDTKNTPSTSHLQGLENVFRKDEHKQSLANNEVLKNAPEQENDHFRVPKII